MITGITTSCRSRRFWSTCLRSIKSWNFEMSLHY